MYSPGFLSAMYHGPFPRFFAGSISQFLSSFVAYFTLEGINVGIFGNISRKYAHGSLSVILIIFGSMASMATSSKEPSPLKASSAPFIGKRKSTYQAPFEGSRARIIVFL